MSRNDLRAGFCLFAAFSLDPAGSENQTKKTIEGHFLTYFPIFFPILGDFPAEILTLSRISVMRLSNVLSKFAIFPISVFQRFEFKRFLKLNAELRYRPKNANGRSCFSVLAIFLDVINRSGCSSWAYI